MNVLVIPSWYPSVDEPQSGIFIYEQALALAKAYPGARFGISTWGQKEEANLLWAKDHFRNIVKFTKGSFKKPSQHKLLNNLWEYYTPAFTWSDKFFEGNIGNIIEANKKNLQTFQKDAGDISLIHAHASFPAGYIAWKLAIKYSIPFIITEHMSPFPFKYYLKHGKIMDKVLSPLQSADAVIAVSDSASKELEQKTGVKPRMIPNLVDEDFFKPSLNSVNRNQKHFTFFSLGRMVPQKGFPDLLQAVNLMQKTNVDFRLGGSGPYLDKYQGLAKNLGVSSKISWLGRVNREQVATEFHNCQAFVLASTHESMGVVFVEALASGKPIIATRCGGPEFIVNAKNGILVDVHAPQQLAKAMDDLIASYATYSPTLIREDFLSRFSSPIITKKIYEVYQAILQKYASRQTS